jgi:hypothetical protein
MPYTDATSSIVNQTIVPDRAILPSGDIYDSTASTSDMKQAQGSSAAHVGSDTSDDPLRSINTMTTTTTIVVAILLASMLSAALVLTLLLYAKHCVKPLDDTRDNWRAPKVGDSWRASKHTPVKSLAILIH